MVLVVLVLIGLFALPGLAAIGLVTAESEGRARAEVSEDQILDGLFATDEQTVTYDTRVYDHLRPAAVVAGAKARGWSLAHDDSGVLLLERG